MNCICSPNIALNAGSSRRAHIKVVAELRVGTVAAYRYGNSEVRARIFYCNQKVHIRYPFRVASRKFPIKTNSLKTVPVNKR
jgi:hypothetical protein